MTIVVATYKLVLASAVTVKAKRAAAARTYEAAIDGFKVVLTLKPEEDEASKSKGERLWSRACRNLEIAVAKDQEEKPPPEFERTARAIRDHTASGTYMMKLRAPYEAVARKAVERFLQYVKYGLRQPRVELGHWFVQGFHDAQWHQGDGTVIHRGGRIAVAGLNYVPLDFGSKKLEAKHRPAIATALAKDRVVQLHEEILSDAQTAATYGNFRRAVLEMAVACEVFVKQTFFGDGPTALVTQALEDQGKLHARVIDLIEIGGEAVLGQRFSKASPLAFKDIDYLFRARNKVAHRGEPKFRDDKGQVRTVDRPMLEAWWKSVDKLFAWGKRV